MVLRRCFCDDGVVAGDLYMVLWDWCLLLVVCCWSWVAAADGFSSVEPQNPLLQDTSPAGVEPVRFQMKTIHSKLELTELQRLGPK